MPKEAIWHNGDRMAFAFIFPDQDGAGLEASVDFTGLVAARQTVEKLDRILIESAECFLLNPRGNHSCDDVLGQARGWRFVEHRTPARAERDDAERPDVVNLGIDRCGV